MPLDGEWFGHFSCPQQQVDARIFDIVANVESQVLANWLLEQHRDAIADGSEGLVEMIEDLSARPADFRVAWDIAFGQARRAREIGRPSAREAAIRIALRLTETGRPGAWRADVSQLAGLRVGKQLLPSGTWLDVQDSGRERRVVIDRGGDAATALRDDDGEWHAERCETLPGFGLPRAACLLPGHALPGGAEGTGFVGVRPAAAIGDDAADGFTAGVRVVAEGAPEWLPWIGRVLRGIIVCPPERGFRAVSGSSDHAPGIIHACYPLGRMDIAESLIHESAHQYFYLIERLGPVDDGSDQQRYWSPPIRRERPLSRILMAYHALANIRLFYAACERSNVEDEGYIASNLPSIDDALASLAEPLGGNPALTPLGRALYEPAQARLDAL
jgi:HEXXH motif-containing protein